MQFNEFYLNYLDEFKVTLDLLDKGLIEELYKELLLTKQNSGSIYVLGNGGSAASASHWVCDFNKGANYSDSDRFRLFSLSDNTPTFSALGNDIAYKDVFLEQLKNYLNKNDLVIGLSVSGNSENIVKAFDYSQRNGARTFSIIGNQEGRMKEFSDNVIVVPSGNYGMVEDVHMYLCHVISQFIYRENKARVMVRK